MINRRVVTAVVWVLYICAVLILLFGKFSSSPDVPDEFLGISMDKLVHFLIFFPSVVLTYFTFYRIDFSARKTFVLFLLSFIAAIAVAALTEVAQHFLPWRTAEPLDFAADAVAIVSSTLLSLIIHLKHCRK